MVQNQLPKLQTWCVAGLSLLHTITRLIMQAPPARGVVPVLHPSVGQPGACAATVLLPNMAKEFAAFGSGTGPAQSAGLAHGYPAWGRYRQLACMRPHLVGNSSSCCCWQQSEATGSSYSSSSLAVVQMIAVHLVVF